MVASGSPFAPVPTATGLRTIGQCNNCFLFPGLGYAAVAVGLRCINNAMIDAGLRALAEHIPASRDPEAPLMPPLEQAAAVASAVAEAVALVGVEQGLARLATTPEQARQRLAESHWRPEYQPHGNAWNRVGRHRSDGWWWSWSRWPCAWIRVRRAAAR